jgi:hypothetical protein
MSRWRTVRRSVERVALATPEPARSTSNSSIVSARNRTKPVSLNDVLAAIVRLQCEVIALWSGVTEPDPYCTHQGSALADCVSESPGGGIA